MFVRPSVSCFALVFQKLDELCLKISAVQQRVVQLAQHALMQHGDLIAKVCGKLQNMCGKYDNMLVLDLAQKLFYFQRDHYVKGGERFVQQNNGGRAMRKHSICTLFFIPWEYPLMSRCRSSGAICTMSK